MTKPDFDVTAKYKDAQLVGLAKQGDRDAFGELIQRHRRKCTNLAMTMLRDRGEAEEETQNACWNAFRHIDQFQGDAEFSTWLLRIVQNQCLMLIRYRRPGQFVHLDERGPDRRPVQLLSPCADPEGELGKQEVLRVLQSEIRRIPRLFRDVLVFCDVEELPMREMAARLGITTAAVKSRLVRARAELRRRMLRHCSLTGAWSLMTSAAAPAERVFQRNASQYPYGNA
jgi:RNA polymerase sigma-70 factor (ECF subfamily)